ncbi:MAG TPA: hypothetical protein VGC01_01110 [Mucilaginibacter sp.]
MKKNKNNQLLLTGLVISLVVFSAFSKADKPSGNLAEQLIGEWRNVYLKIIIHNKSKPQEIVQADSTNWETRLGIKPIRTYFLENGTYYSEYRNLKDSVVRKASGTWSLKKGDSIIMTQLSPDKSVLKLKMQIINDHATFTGLIDFDGEGIDNDEYFGIHKKFK